ncbi:cytochrome c oxidase assembly protein cox19 [Russula decolorans]
MSFGRPPSISTGFQVTPPNRGSFPLDHYGECKAFMTQYLECLKRNSSTSSECRHLNRDYLGCRMKNGLMEKDEWKNLGLSNLKVDDHTSRRDGKT